MGFIKAFSGALGGMFADQWKDFYVPSTTMTATTGVACAVPQGQNNGRGSNTNGSVGIITNGSKIVVPEGMALVTLQDGAITGVVAEAGGFIFTSDDINSQSIFAGDGVLSTVIKMTWERIKFGGQPASQQQAYYVNLKEIPGNRFGTQAPIYWDDAYLNAQAGAMVRGTYSLKIADPLLFVKNFVPAAYLQPGAEAFDFADMDNTAGSQLFNEVVGSLGAAFANYSNDPARERRITRLQADQLGFAQSLSAAVEEAYQWRSDRGLEIVKTAIVAIEYDDETRKIIDDVRKADALMGARGNSFMQQAAARGIQAAGENGGGATAIGMMGMGMNAAGAAMGGLQQPVNPYQQAQQPAAQSAAQAEDPVAKLQQLKTMLDAGLITQADYDAAKNKILGL